MQRSRVSRIVSRIGAAGNVHLTFRRGRFEALWDLSVHALVIRRIIRRALRSRTFRLKRGKGRPLLKIHLIRGRERPIADARAAGALSLSLSSALLFIFHFISLSLHSHANA